MYANKSCKCYIYIHIYIYRERERERELGPQGALGFWAFLHLRSFGSLGFLGFTVLRFIGCYLGQCKFHKNIDDAIAYIKNLKESQKIQKTLNKDT